MDALQSMEKYLSTRPTRFPSLLSGIEWQYVSLPIIFYSHHDLQTPQVLAPAQSGTLLPLAPRFRPSYMKKASPATRLVLGCGAPTSPQRNPSGKTGLLV